MAWSLGSFERAAVPSSRRDLSRTVGVKGHMDVAAPLFARDESRLTGVGIIRRIESIFFLEKERQVFEIRHALRKAGK